MKKPLTLIPLLLLAALCAPAQTLYFQDNFDSYTAGQYLTTQTTEWVTWTGGHGNDQDPFVSNVQSHSYPNAVNITGVNDILYNFQNQTTGHYVIEMDFLFQQEVWAGILMCSTMQTIRAQNRHSTTTLTETERAS